MTARVSSSSELEVPFSRVAAFIRQVTHDVRNNLNAMDLQAAFAAELITDKEAAEEVRRIRQQVQHATRQLQALSANFQVGTPSLVSYSAKIFMEDLRDRLTKVFPEGIADVSWSDSLADEDISIDIEMVFNAIAEVFRNAIQFRESGGQISVDAHVEGGQMVVEIRETKSSVPSDPSNWGREPFVSTRRGGYGLGLFRAHRLLEAQGGDLSATHDSTGGIVTTRVILPLAS
jgi:K+-sensing histidine kinase KdpD